MDGFVASVLDNVRPEIRAEVAYALRLANINALHDGVRVRYPEVLAALHGAELAEAAKEWPRALSYNAWTLEATLSTGRQVSVGLSVDGAHWVFAFGDLADPDGCVRFGLSAEAFEAVEDGARLLRLRLLADAAEEPSPRQVQPAIREDQ